MYTRLLRWLRGAFVTILVAFFWFISTSQPAMAGGFFEVGQVTLSDTIDNGLWVTVNLTQTYVNPVVIAGPLTHNNDLSLSVRVRNVTSTSFQIGMQSPCENTGTYAGGATCPPGGGWLAETVDYWVVEEGSWIFPDGTEVEADRHNTNTVRAGVGGQSNSSDLMSYVHTYPAAPIVFHQVNSFSDSDWIASSVWGPGAGAAGRGTPPSTTGFRIALEGAEVTSSHGSEDIGWVAIESGSGTNAGYVYDAGRTSNRIVDRHTDGCYAIGSFSFASTPMAVSVHNSMNGGNGGWVRLCLGGIQTSQINVHMDEDQVNDGERTGVPEYGAWFAYESGGFGALDFLTSTITVTDDNGGQVLPGDTLTYTIVINNVENDFAQVDNGTPEFTDPIPTDTTYVLGSTTATSGAFSYNAGMNRMDWNGSVPASGTVTLTYQVQIDAGASCTDISNQGELHMDPNGDGINSIDEVSDDPGLNDGLDTDGDNSTGDDDPTILPVACADMGVTKTVDNPTPDLGEIINFTVIVTNFGPDNATGIIFTDNLPASVTYVSATPSQGTCSGTTTIVCDLGGLASGVSANVIISVSTADVGTAVNSASVIADQADPVFANNTDTVSVNVLSPTLPATGFAPGQLTRLPNPPTEMVYRNLGGLWLEFDNIEQRLSIVGLPLQENGWDATWLWNQAGYLEGSAFPTWPGNTLLTGHSYLADGTPGPFLHLNELRWGDEVIIHAFGMRHVYSVRQIMIVEATDLSVFQHEEYDWITLITCRGFDERTGAYHWRLAVRAVLIRVETES